MFCRLAPQEIIMIPVKTSSARKYSYLNADSCAYVHKNIQEEATYLYLYDALKLKSSVPM